MGKVVPLGNVTKLDLPPDQILEGMLGKLECLVVVGYDKEGQEFFSSSIADGGTVMWLLERCKRELLTLGDGIDV